MCVFHSKRDFDHVAKTSNESIELNNFVVGGVSQIIQPNLALVSSVGRR